MGYRSAAQSPGGIVDVNMTPLIDVSLVMVVILMVTTPLTLQSSIAVNAGAAGGRQAQVTSRADRIELAVLSDESVRVNRFVVPRAALGATLAPLLRASATKVVVVECADAVSHGAFVGVLDEAKALGAAQVAVAGDR